MDCQIAQDTGKRKVIVYTPLYFGKHDGQRAEAEGLSILDNSKNTGWVCTMSTEDEWIGRSEQLLAQIAGNTTSCRLAVRSDIIRRQYTFREHEDWWEFRSGRPNPRPKKRVDGVMGLPCPSFA